MPQAPLAKLRLYMRTASFLRRKQLAYMTYRRVLRPVSRPRRAGDRVRLRANLSVDFITFIEPRALDQLSLGIPNDRFDRKVDWRTNNLWRPLRYQVHYFDFLNDSHYPQAWKGNAIDDWIAMNPMASGDGWIPYAVSLRIVNWIKFFQRGDPLTNKRAVGSLYAQALWLENNLELHILANHYLKNAKALLFAGLFFDGTDAQRWLRIGCEVFLSEMGEQFLTDGGHYERSPMYHAMAAEDILDALNYLAATSLTIDPKVIATLRQYARAALDFYDEILFPDGSVALFNDAAHGTGPTPQELFAYGLRVLGYQRAHKGEELTIRSFPASGYYVIRDGGNMMVVDCGEPGPHYQPGHAHCDALSYELAVNGELVVIDTGVLDYEDNAERRYARSTAAHNTLQVDGAEQSEMWGVFRVGRRITEVSATLAKSQADSAVFSGSHNGFRVVAPDMVHRREVRYGHGTWSFVDRIDGSGKHEVVSRVHLRPGLAAHVEGSTIFVSGTAGRIVAEVRAEPTVSLRVEEAPYYRSFGNSRTGYVIVMNWHGELPVTLFYTLTSGS